MTQKISSPPEEAPKHHTQPLPAWKPRFSTPGIISLLALIGLLLLLFTGLAVRNIPQAVKSPVKKSIIPQLAASPTAIPASAILQLPGKSEQATLQIPAGQFIVYEHQNNIYYTSAINASPHLITTPGYLYNRSATPILTPAGQLLYSGNGLWLTDIFSGSPHRIATLPAGQVVTSLVLSKDGSNVAWSSEPKNGYGDVTIYAGPLEHSVPVYQHTINDCPCFRVFSFMNDHNKLLLADDRGDHHAVQYGLWSFDLAQKPLRAPKQLLNETQPSGPLALSGNILLYSSYEGFVPAPTDSSVPDDAASLTYANSLYITTANSNPPSLGTAKEILSEQHELSNSAEYRWVTTPLFSPDAHTLFYVEFSSDAQDPYTRRSALYSVQLSGTNGQPQVGAPQLLATTTAHFMELGAWINPHILTFYADGNMYALDTISGAAVALANLSTQSANAAAYSRIVAVVSHGSR